MNEKRCSLTTNRLSLHHTLASAVFCAGKEKILKNALSYFLILIASFMATTSPKTRSRKKITPVYLLQSIVACMMVVVWYILAAALSSM